MREDLADESEDGDDAVEDREGKIEGSGVVEMGVQSKIPL